MNKKHLLHNCTSLVPAYLYPGFLNKPQDLTLILKRKTNSAENIG